VGSTSPLPALSRLSLWHSSRSFPASYRHGTDPANSPSGRNIFEGWEALADSFPGTTQSKYTNKNGLEMETQPAYRVARLPGLFEVWEPPKVWGNSCAASLRKGRARRLGPVSIIRVTVLHRIAMKPYQQLSASQSLRAGSH